MLTTCPLPKALALVAGFLAVAASASPPGPGEDDPPRAAKVGWPYDARRAGGSRSRLPRDEAPPTGLAADAAGRRIYRWLEGLDDRPVLMDPEEVNRELNDPMALLLLRRETFPATLLELIAGLNARRGEAAALPDQMSFIVGEGADIPFTGAPQDLRRTLRFVTARLKEGAADLLVSTAAPAPDDTFLQVVAWDARVQGFNFYERPTDSGRPNDWVWRGASRHALQPSTRGRGCFACHTGGAPVMKELRQPWLHWKSMGGAPFVDALAPDAPLRSDPLFLASRGAEDLEDLIVRPAVQRLYQARSTAWIAADGTVAGLPALLRPLFESTGVNLATSPDESRGRGEKQLPRGFLLNDDLLLGSSQLQVDPPDDFAPARIPNDLYADSLRAFGFRQEDGAFRRPGDSYFAFVVPVPSIEDVAAIKLLVARGVVTPKFAATALAVDFPNPVFSPRRAALLRHVPPTGRAAGVPDAAVSRIKTAAGATPNDSPEREFLGLWELAGDAWKAEITRRIGVYLASVRNRLATAEGVRDYSRLAESRRRDFARLPIREEFPLMLPVTDIPAGAPALRMKEDGTLAPRD